MLRSKTCQQTGLSLTAIPRCVLLAVAAICFASLGCSNEKTETTEGKGAEDAVAGTTAKVMDTLPETPAGDAAKPPKTETTKEEPPTNNPAFHDTLVETVDSYLQYAMVNSIAIQAPEDCRAPREPEAQPKMSQSVHQSSHGQKLYYLFAKDITHYLTQNGTDAPVGQALVKESWTSKPSNPDARNLRNHASGNRINPRTTVGDKVFEIGKRTDLFVMTKLKPETEGTDQGWIYGVVNPDTKQVTASGRVSSCMQCHESAKNDRLFGPDLDD